MYDFWWINILLLLLVPGIFGKYKWTGGAIISEILQSGHATDLTHLIIFLVSALAQNLLDWISVKDDFSVAGTTRSEDQWTNLKVNRESFTLERLAEKSITKYNPIEVASEALKVLRQL